MQKCERCDKEDYVIYIGDWGHICPECEDLRRKMNFMEQNQQLDVGWDHDDLDCPEYGEVIIQVLDGGKEENDYGKKEKMGVFRGENSNR